MKTQRELNLEYWGRIHDMVDAYNKAHGTDIRPWECVKYKGKICLTESNFGGTPGWYGFAIAILEGRPVFVGDMLWHKTRGVCTEIKHYHISNIALDSEWTWDKPTPKRTFSLNGVELPPPEICDGGFPLYIDGTRFHFKSEKDRNQVRDAIRKILTEVRDKP